MDDKHSESKHQYSELYQIPDTAILRYSQGKIPSTYSFFTRHWQFSLSITLKLTLRWEQLGYMAVLQRHKME